MSSAILSASRRWRPRRAGMRGTWRDRTGSPTPGLGRKGRRAMPASSPPLLCCCPWIYMYTGHKIRRRSCGAGGGGESPLDLFVWGIFCRAMLRCMIPGTNCAAPNYTWRISESYCTARSFAQSNDFWGICFLISNAMVCFLYV